MTERVILAGRSRWRRGRTILLTTALLAVVFFFVTGPPAPVSTRPVAGGGADPIVRGAFHIHTTRSDGALDKADVAAAAARAGLKFAIFTDHGDATRAPDPPVYIDGVLCIDGVEISTDHGHYIGVGMRAAPYPLGGDGEAVAEDVARLGGFGVAAHPGSPRPELAWTDWRVPFDSLEWLNADSEWRDESRPRLARALLDYVWRPAGSLAALLDRPVEVLRRWDELVSHRRVVGLAAHDAHGGVGEETGSARGRRLHVPSYESSFRTFSVYAMPTSPLTSSAAADARLLLTAIREGKVFTAIDAVAAPASFSFSAAVEGQPTTMGGVLPGGVSPALFSARAAVPEEATIVLLRNGRVVAETKAGELNHAATMPGAYRVEVHVPGGPGTPRIPWLVSNPIYRFAGDASSSMPSKPVVASVSLTRKPWRVESDAGSSGTVIADDRQVRLEYRLRGGTRESQFVALVVDLADVPPDVNAIVVRGLANAPMRASAQLRFARDGDTRWRKSIYFDNAEARDLLISLDALRPAERPVATGGAVRPPARPDITRATSLLFVIDLTNAAPGAQGSLTLSDVALVREE